MWSTTRNAQENPKKVIGIVNSMKRRYAPIKDSEVSTNGSNDHEISTRCGKPKEGGMPQQKSAKGGMPQYDDLQRSINRLSSEKNLQNI